MVSAWVKMGSPAARALNPPSPASSTMKMISFTVSLYRVHEGKLLRQREGYTLRHYGDPRPGLPQNQEKPRRKEFPVRQYPSAFPAPYR